MRKRKLIPLAVAESIFGRGNRAQTGRMVPSTHSKRLKAKRKQSRRKGHG